MKIIQEKCGCKRGDRPYYNDGGAVYIYKCEQHRRTNSIPPPPKSDKKLDTLIARSSAIISKG